MVSLRICSLYPHLTPGQVNTKLLHGFIGIVKVAVHEREAVQPRQRQQLRQGQHARQVHVILDDRLNYIS